MEKRENIFLVFFIGVLLTSLGSSYYHYNPNDSTLVWDRLPMTIVFISFFCAVVYERVSQKLALSIFLPLLIGGIASVLYWHLTEARIPGGDLRYYIDIQYYPLILLLYILPKYKSAYKSNNYEMKVLLYYLIAKVFEILDGFVFLTTGIISGHTIKHLVSGYSTYLVLKNIKSRRQVQ